MFDNNSIIYQKAYQKVRRRFWEKALRRHKSYPISIVSILRCSNSRRIHRFTNKRGTAWNRNVFRNCFSDRNWDAPVSYWPIRFPVPNNSPRRLLRKLLGSVSSFLKWRMTVQVCNFVSSFILIFWDRFFPFRSWRQRAWKGTNFKLATSFIEFLHTTSIAMETKLLEDRWVCQRCWGHRATRTVRNVTRLLALSSSLQFSVI